MQLSSHHKSIPSTPFQSPYDTHERTVVVVVVVVVGTVVVVVVIVDVAVVTGGFLVAPIVGGLLVLVELPVGATLVLPEVRVFSEVVTGDVVEVVEMFPSGSVIGAVVVVLYE